MTLLRRFLDDRSGAYAIMMGVATIPLLLGVGFAVDYGRMVKARSHMQDLADGASLRLAASRERNRAALEAMATDYVAANRAPDTLPEVSLAALDLENEDEIGLTLQGRIPTYFMGLANYDSLDVSTFALAKRAMSGSVEMSLVLDNTYSMSFDGKIGALKVAAKDLVGKLLAEPKSDVRVALVPYAEQVNIGTGHRGAPWLSVPDDYAKTTTTTTTTPAQPAQPAKDGYYTTKYKNGACQEWKTTPASKVEKDGMWVDVPASTSCSKYEQIPYQAWVAPQPAKPATPAKTTTTTTTSHYKWLGCVGMRVDNKKLVLNDGTPGVPYPGLMTFPNKPQRCLTEIVPLTSNKAKLDAAIAGLITGRSGWEPDTYIPNGLMWGINTLSPTAPYEEGKEYDAHNIKPRKVIVLMTDGLNTRRPNVTGLLNTEFQKKSDEVFGVTVNGNTVYNSYFIGGFTSADVAQRLDVNADTLTLCNYAKSKGIEIFTVAFQVKDENAKAMLESCASSAPSTADHYYDATDSSKLAGAFSDIVKKMEVVRLAQ